MFMNHQGKHDLILIRQEYDELGFDTIPLKPGSKVPFRNSWQTRSPNRLWWDVPQDVNIGIRGGGLADLAVIDCDHPITFENVTRWLEGLGYQPGDYPIVQTASGKGKHVYTTFSGGLSGDWRVLSKEIGAGEFRFGSGSYVVAPPSMVNGGGVYTLLDGNFSRLPVLALDDISLIIDNHENNIAKRPTPSRNAQALLCGKGFENYKSRSEAEEAIIVSLVNSGFSFSEVLELFNRYPCFGKFDELKRQNTKNAERYLEHSFNSAAKWASDNESKPRKKAKAAIEWAEAAPWPGRTGAVDQRVYMAHLHIAYKAGRLSYAAGSRTLAELAGISRDTAAKATHRLCNKGLITLEAQAAGDCASIYRIKEMDKTGHFLSTSNMRKCQIMSIGHDAFRRYGLGTSASQVWQVLLGRSLSVKEIAEQTGRHEKTIRRILYRMAKIVDPTTGEVLPMVASDDFGKTFYALNVDLDRIARVIGTNGMGEQQKAKHERERRLHARSLAFGRLATPGPNPESY